MNPQVLQAGAITATLIRSKLRKSLGIYIHQGKVTVRAPMHESLHNIQQFFQHKQSWIQSHLQRQLQIEQKAQHSFLAGDRFLWLDNELILATQQGRPAKVESCNNTLHVVCARPHDPRNVRRQIETWYKTQALQYLQQRCEVFSKILNLHPQSISVRRYKTRWGSCNHRGELQFNWLIMMAPAAVVDYLVVHELCHLKHFNHSAKFWQLVSTTLPHYANCRQWLKQQSQLAWPEND